MNIFSKNGDYSDKYHGITNNSLSLHKEEFTRKKNLKVVNFALSNTYLQSVTKTRILTIFKNIKLN